MMSSKHLRSRNHAPVEMGGLNVAKQLYLPANFMRILELLFSLIAFGLVLGWNSGGVTYRDLSQGDVNIINNLNFFLAVSVISGVAAGVVCLIVLLELRSFTSLLDLILSGTFSLFWVIASIVMYVGLSSIAYTDSIKEADVTFTNLEAALGIGFANGVYFGGSAWFALSAHREAGEPAFGPSRLSAHLPSDILNDTEQRNKIFSPEATTF